MPSQPLSNWLIAHFILALFFRLASAASIGQFGELEIVNRKIAPDGFTRPTVLAGGTFPGPLIKGQKGGHFRLNVVDKLFDPSMVRSTSIHWHGLFQKGTAWADGPAFVTQCPIVSNHSFLYDFSVPDQAGTFWYHSHVATQYCDGLRGPFIVYDPLDPHRYLYDVDDESTVITLADWYHQVAPTFAGMIPPAPDSTLINGVGRTVNGTKVPLAIVNVVHGKRYRFRVIGISCDPNFLFSVDNHEMTIIEADGINTQPLVVDQVQIFAAQRYSLIITANQPVDNYYIRAEPNLGAQGFVGGINSAILRYKGAPPVEPKTSRSVKKPFVETSLHPLRACKSKSGVPGKHFPGGADVNINMEFHFNATTVQFEVNGFPFINPTVPVLLQILSGARTAQDLLPVGSVYTLPPNKVIELSIPGQGAGGPHPFHLHGQTFHVIRSANSTVYNFNDPVERDTVSTGNVGDNTTIRFVTSNDGPWFLHCDWHLDLGLAVVMATDPAGTPLSNPVPQSWKELCPLYDSLTPSQLP